MFILLVLQDQDAYNNHSSSLFTIKFSKYNYKCYFKCFKVWSIVFMSWKKESLAIISPHFHFGEAKAKRKLKF